MLWPMARHLLLLVLLALAGYGFLLQKDAVPYSPHSDDIAYNVATKQILHRSLARGDGLPFWRSDQLSGTTALTQPQTLYTYPLHFLFYLLPPTQALGGTHWLQLLAAGLSCYLLGLALGLGGHARLLMGAAGLFNFKLIIATYAGWLAVIPSMALAPLFLAALIAAARRPTPGRAVLLALAAGLSLHVGHLQQTYYTTLLFGLGLLVSGAWQARKLRAVPRGWLRGAACLVGAAVAAAGLGAYLLLPLAEDAPLVSRTAMSYATFMQGEGIGLGHLATFLYPEALGTPVDHTYARVELWGEVGYFGLVPLLLAVVGAAVSLRRGGIGVLLAAGFLASLLLCFDSPVLRAFFHWVPGFKLFRAPERILYLAGILGIALAGVGFQAMMEAAGRLTSPRRWRAIIAVAAVGLIAAEGSYWARRYLTMVDTATAFPRPAYASFLSREEEPFRVAPSDKNVITYGWAAHLGLELVAGYEPFNLWHYQEYMDLLREGRVHPRGMRIWTDMEQVARPDLLDLLNVRYLATRRPLQKPPPHLSLAARFQDQPVFHFYRGLKKSDIHLYKNARALPRAFLAREVLRAPDHNAAVALVASRPLGAVAVVEGDGAGGGPSPWSPEDRVKVTAWGDGKLRAEVVTAMRRFLVISEVWHPGWEARLGGSPLRLERTNLALLGAWIPPGKHKLELEFTPPRWRLGVGVSLATALGLLGFAGWVVARRRRRGGRPDRDADRPLQ